MVGIAVYGKHGQLNKIVLSFPQLYSIKRAANRLLFLVNNTRHLNRKICQVWNKLAR